MDDLIATVNHYYSRIGVAVLDMCGELHIGDYVLVQGHTSDFSQQVCSLELNHHKIQFAGPGMEVALKVSHPVRRGDRMYKVSELVET